MTIKIIKKKITRDELENIAKENYGDMIKGVVDIKKEIIALGGEFHSDANTLLIEKQRSNQRNIWGFNIFPDRSKEQWIEFVSLINIRPADNNFDIEIQNSGIKEKIKQIINKLIE